MKIYLIRHSESIDDIEDCYSKKNNFEGNRSNLFNI